MLISDITPAHSVADVLLDLSFAQLTLDVTTPVEATLTSLCHDTFVRLEVPPATHQLAAVHRLGRPIAASPVRPQRARLWVGVTEVWRRLQVDEVRLRVRFEVGVARHQVAPRADAPQLNLCGAVELLFEFLADATERR